MTAAIFERLRNNWDVDTVPIAWPGSEFTPASEAEWLEIRVARQQMESGRPGTPGPDATQAIDAQSPTRVGDNELLDETLPTAGGGAAAGGGVG